MKKFKNLFFYIAIMGVFSALMYWIVVMGKAKEAGRNVVTAAADHSAWQQFTEGLVHSLQHPLAILLAQIVTIILAARLFGWVCKKIGQPSVVGGDGRHLPDLVGADPAAGLGGVSRRRRHDANRGVRIRRAPIRVQTKTDTGTTMTSHDARAGHDHGSHDHDGEAGHDHAGHSHGPGHSHAPASFGTAFAIGIALNVGFVAVEATYGVLANSVALLADAGHNLSDVLGLIVAWIATVLARRAPSARFTYGMKASSILAALFNAVFLLVAVGAIAWEAIQRFGEPVPVAGKTVMVVAAIGILVNGITAWLFASGAKGDINIRGAFLHMAADAAVSAGVVIAGLVILYTGWTWLDPVVSLAIVAVIVWSTWGLLRDSLTLSLAAVPPGIDPVAVRRHLEGLPGVAALHDLHIWAMSTTDTCLTAHLLMPGGRPDDAFLMAAATGIRERFGISHTTLQVETSEATACALAPDHVV